MASRPMESSGAFDLSAPSGRRLFVIFSAGTDWAQCGFTGEPWEHASVSVGGDVGKVPTWAEMDFVKGLFWGDEETVVQLHVPRADHVDQHAGCLHLWRPTCTPLPRPPAACVGEKGAKLPAGRGARR